MSSLPTEKELLAALVSAARAHHKYQDEALGGIHHQKWALWYAAYILGRIGDFTTATYLSQWLEEVTDKNDWFKSAAKHILVKISSQSN